MLRVGDFIWYSDDQGVSHGGYIQAIDLHNLKVTIKHADSTEIIIDAGKICPKKPSLS